MTVKGGAAAPSGRGAFYRLMRDWHGYLSAVAFLALLFFAITGILINHPNLIPGKGKPYIEGTLQLSPDELARVKAAPEPGRELVEILHPDRIRLAGAYEGGDIGGPDLFVRMEGVRGNSDLTMNLETGVVNATVSPTATIEIFNGLHRGELAGTVWKLVIDVLAVLMIAVAILGYILFFSLRFRVKTALILTGASLVVLAGLFWVFVP